MKSILAEINAKVGWMNLWVDGFKKKNDNRHSWNKTGTLNDKKQGLIKVESSRG